MKNKSVIAFAGYFCCILSVLLMTACNKQSKEPEADPAYLAEINQWHNKRIESLKADTGWLSLTGLFWLSEGKNTFGSDSSNALIFPGENIPLSIGTFKLSKGEVTMTVNNGAHVLHNNEPVTCLKMINDIEGNATVAELGSLNWHVIKREDRYGIRLKNKKSPQLLNFQGIDRFPVDPDYKVTAYFRPYTPEKSIVIPNVIGQETEEQCPGYLEFTLNGKQFTLDVMGSSDNRPFFLIFSDNTNGELTYGAGRFLSVERPNEHGITKIDFNKSYCPPCAFTKFATCPLPPTQNYLDIEVKAGEKKPKHPTH